MEYHECKIIRGDEEYIFNLTKPLAEEEMTLENLLIQTKGTFHKLVKNNKRLLSGYIYNYYGYSNGKLFATGYFNIDTDYNYVREGTWTYFRSSGVHKISYLANMYHGWCISLLNDGTVRQLLFENNVLVGKRIIKEGLTIRSTLGRDKLMKWGDPVMRLV